MGRANGLLEATRRVAAAASDAEFEAALLARGRIARDLGRVGAEHAEEVRAAIALGEQVRVELLRAIARLRAMTPACHARSSVACTG